jgi:hypothetical protein
MHDELKATMNQGMAEQARQIPTQLIENSEKLAVLGKGIAELEDRLTLVLQKKAEEELAKQQADIMPSGIVPLAMSLMEQSYKISELTKYVDDIIKRLEL